MHMRSVTRTVAAAILLAAPTACYEEVPEVSASSGDAGTTADASTSGAATTAATTGTTTTATTATTGTSTGPGTCMPSGAPQTIDCGAGQMCTPDTQACCYTFLAIASPELACGCPDACGPNASEFRCDGPEDCPPGQMCCAAFDGAISRASCMSELDCFGPMGGIPLCHSVADCPPAPGTACGPAFPLPDIPNHMGVCTVDDYTGCTGPADCPDTAGACLSEQTGGSACTRPCEMALDCPPPLSGESLPPSCIEGLPTSNGKGCVFVCQTNRDCPMGMDCREVTTDSAPVMICLHP